MADYGKLGTGYATSFLGDSEVYKSVRGLLKDLLYDKLGCDIQHKSFPCNSCFHTLKLKLGKDIHDYWVSVLAFRGDYDDEEPMTQSHWENVIELMIALDGKDRKFSEIIDEVSRIPREIHELYIEWIDNGEVKAKFV